MSVSRAIDIASLWQDGDKAKALLSRVDGLSRLSDQLAGQELPSVVEAINEAINEAECDLDALREAALDEAIREWPEDGIDEDYVRDELEGYCTSVEDAVRDAARQWLGDPEGHIRHIGGGRWQIAA